MRVGGSLQHILGAHITPGPDAAPVFFFFSFLVNLHVLLRFLIPTPTSLLSVHCHPTLLPESSQMCPQPQWKPTVMFVYLFLLQRQKIQHKQHKEENIYFSSQLQRVQAMLA